MVRIIPWDVRIISLRNTELGPVILPMRSRPKKAVRVAAQNCRSGRRCKRSWWYIICKCCGRIGALGVGQWPLLRLIPRSTVDRYQLSWDGTGKPNSWWMIRMMLRYWKLTHNTYPWPGRKHTSQLYYHQQGTGTGDTGHRIWGSSAGGMYMWLW